MKKPQDKSQSGEIPAKKKVTPGKQHIPKKNILDALKLSGGLIRPAAEMLHCSRQTLYKRISKDQSLKDAVDDARESCLDLAEGQLLKNIKAGKEASLIFYLKTQGYKRGYTSKTKDEDADVTFTLELGTDLESKDQSPE
jgi:hypothetical protein